MQKYGLEQKLKIIKGKIFLEKLKSHEFNLPLIVGVFLIKSKISFSRFQIIIIRLYRNYYNYFYYFYNFGNNNLLNKIFDFT